MLLVSFRSSRLNEDQLKIVNYALAGDSRPMAPLVVYGAFGTGKTEALAQTTLMLASQSGNRTRVLVCTHTNAYVYDIGLHVYLYGETKTLLSALEI